MNNLLRVCAVAAVTVIALPIDSLFAATTEYWCERIVRQNGSRKIVCRQTPLVGDHVFIENSACPPSSNNHTDIVVMSSSQKHCRSGVVNYKCEGAVNNATLDYQVKGKNASCSP